MSRRRPSPVTRLLDVEELLEEILLRLPPLPSSLPRASLVCKRCRSILSHPRFLNRFRKHHPKPPLLGFFIGYFGEKPIFTPVLNLPDHIPATRFSMTLSHHLSEQWFFMGCHHSLAILINSYLSEVAVWDPLTGQQHRVSYPHGLCNTTRDSFYVQHTAVVCADDEDGHVHGDCFLSPFKVILICGGARDILAFDMERRTLDMIEKPTGIYHTNCWSFQILQKSVDSGLHLAVVSKLSIQIWRRNSCSDGVVGWMLLQKNNLMEGLLPWGLVSCNERAVIVGYDEVSNEIVMTTYIGDFMLQLESMQFRRISERRNFWGSYKIHYPYRNLYTTGRRVG